MIAMIPASETLNDTWPFEPHFTNAAFFVSTISTRELLRERWFYGIDLLSYVYYIKNSRFKKTNFGMEDNLKALQYYRSRNT